MPILRADRFLDQVNDYLSSYQSSLAQSLPAHRDGSLESQTKTRRVLDAVIACVVKLNMYPNEAPFVNIRGGARALWIRTSNQVLFEAWAKPSLEAVQALVLLAFASITSDWNDLRGWNLIGSAARLR